MKRTTAPLACTAFCLIALASEAQVTGEVKDGFGNPLGNVEVSIIGTTLKTTTSGSGKYSVRYVPGRFGVHFAKEGYTDFTVNQDVSVETNVPLQAVVLYKLPSEQALWFFGANDYIPLKIGRLNLIGGSREKFQYVYDMTYNVSGEYARIPQAESHRFLDTSPAKLILLKVGDDNVVATRREAFSGIGDTKAVAIKDDWKQIATKEGVEIGVRQVSLQPGRYAYVAHRSRGPMGMGPEDLVSPVFLFEVVPSGVNLAPAPQPSASGQPTDPQPTDARPLLCPDYDSCFKSSVAALQARRWDEAIAYSEEATKLAPARGDAWMMAGAAYFGRWQRRGDLESSWSNFDKGLSLGAILTAEVCRERTFQPCERGLLRLSSKEVRFLNQRNEKVFSAPPSEVTSRAATLYYTGGAAYSWLTIGGKSYRLYPIPTGAACQIQLVVVCPEPGFSQQKVFADYVHHAIQGLTSGALTKPEPPPAPATFAVVPGGTIGQFRHGSLVTKLPSGSLVLAPTPQDATHTHAGVDLPAEIGTPVYALADGTVVDLIVSDRDTNFASLGYMVIIKHTEPIAGKDTYSAYFHLHEPPAVAFNQAVLGGRTQIGVVGKSGAATGPHLHLEIRHFRSRFFEHPEWTNIYGSGDQRSKPVFLEGWSDPEKLGVRLY